MQKNNRAKVVFIDRDGTINKEVDNLRRVEDLRLLPNVAAAIRLLNKKKFVVIVISNQPVIAHGWLTEKKLKVIHQVIANRLKRKKAILDAIYYCPHHPDATILKYRKDCPDRKPKTGLLQKAGKEFHISLENAFLIGDSTIDIKTAMNAGIRPILVKTGYGGKDGKFDVKAEYIAENLLDAAQYITKK